MFTQPAKAGLVVASKWVEGNTGDNRVQGVALHDVSFADCDFGIAVGNREGRGDFLRFDYPVVMRTNDGGMTWVDLARETSSDPITGQTPTGKKFYPDFAHKDGGLDAVVALKGADGKYKVWIGGKGGKIVRTADGAAAAGAIVWNTTGGAVANTEVENIQMTSETTGWSVGYSAIPDEIDTRLKIRSHTGYGKVQATTDGGQTWTTRFTSTDVSAGGFEDLAIRGATMWTTQDEPSKVWKTTNSWTTPPPVTSSDPLFGLPSQGHLLGIAFRTDLEGWVTSSNGTIMHTINGGTSWTSQSVTGLTSEMEKVRFADFNHGWIVVNGQSSTDGRILAYNGTSWSSAAPNGLPAVGSGNPQALRGLATLKLTGTVGGDGVRAWAVGDDGKVFIYKDGTTTCVMPAAEILPIVTSSPSPSPSPASGTLAAQAPKALPRTGSGPVQQTPAWLAAAIVTGIIALGGVVTAVRLMPKRRKG
jgi:photosystem II stability/assembly factor-like uncharacterized protein